MSFVSLATISLGALSAALLSGLLTFKLLALPNPLGYQEGFAAGFLKQPPRKRWPAVGLTVFCLISFFDISAACFLTLLGLIGWLLINRAPVWKRNRDAHGKVAAMRELFPQSLGLAVQSLKSGQTVPQALEHLSLESPSPLREEWAEVCAEMNLGVSAENALTHMSGKFPKFNELSHFLESYKISRQTGSNLIPLLELLAGGMEEKNRLTRKMDSLTAQARLSGIMMGCLPFLLAFVFFLMDPALIMPLFTDPKGWAILLLAAFLETIGFLWIHRLLRLES